MKLVLAGGTGLVGTILSRAFHEAGHDVIVLSRQVRQAPWRVVPWDGRSLGDWVGELDGADVIVNLAGQSVNCRYGPKNRRLILDSRIQSTRIIGEAIAKCAHPPKVWLQASTATIYSHRFDASNTEADGVIGGAEPNLPETWRFSIEVATAWEKTLEEAATPSTRKVLLRSAIVMSPDRGGAFDILLRLVRLHLGGASGNGRQYVSWIHDEDFVRAVLWIIEHTEFSGPVNLCAPNPLPNTEFMRALRKAWGARIGLPATEWMLEIGTFFLRTESELVLKSRRVSPQLLMNSGFTFRFSSWEEASKDLCRRRRQCPES